MNKINLTLTGILILCVTYLFVQNNRMDRELSVFKDGLDANQEVKTNSDSEVELVHSMTLMHIYMNKLYFAGKEKNKKLVRFYLHEIEEIMEEIAEGQVTEDGYNISEMMQSFGLNQVEIFEEANKEDITFESFEENYKRFIQNSCNNCHLSTKHEYIKITLPTSPVLSNQDFVESPSPLNPSPH
jgi:hypothetical protein